MGTPPSSQLATLRLPCEVDDALVNQRIKEPRDGEDAANDRTELHNKVRGALPGLRVSHRHRRKVVSQVEGWHLLISNLVRVGGELVDVHWLAVQWQVCGWNDLRVVL